MWLGSSQSWNTTGSFVKSIVFQQCAYIHIHTNHMCTRPLATQHTTRCPQQWGCHPESQPAVTQPSSEHRQIFTNSLLTRDSNNNKKAISSARSGQAWLPLLGSCNTQTWSGIACSAACTAHRGKMQLSCWLTLSPPGSSPDLQEVVVTHTFPNQVVAHLAPGLLVLPQEDHVCLDLLCHALQRGIGRLHVCLAQPVLSPIWCGVGETKAGSEHHLATGRALSSWLRPSHPSGFICGLEVSAIYTE